MLTSMDPAGRVVIPKTLRDSTGLKPKMKLNIAEHDGCLVIEPAPVPMHLERRDGVLVAVPEVPVPTLTADQVRDVLESGRR